MDAQVFLVKGCKARHASHSRQPHVMRTTPELADHASGVRPGAQNRKASASIDGVTWQSGKSRLLGKDCQNFVSSDDPLVSSTCRVTCKHT